MLHPAASIDRFESERAFHDQQAEERTATFLHHPTELCFADHAYLDHETWIRPAFAALGDIRGSRVLDYGCGHGMAGVVLARAGARVTAFDLSRGYLAEARRRTDANGVSLDFVQANGERLPFADASFDRVWGNAVLHHLDPRVAGRELQRVLRPGGWAVFCEPWGENPLLRWARNRLPYRAKQRTPEEEPLRLRQVAQLREVFPQLTVHGYQFVSMLRRVLPSGRLVHFLDHCDQVFLKRCPSLQRFCRYVVLVLPR